MMRLLALPAGLLVALSATSPVFEPCLRPSRAGTRVSGEVRVCPGRYRIPDPREQGVLVVMTDDTRLDLRGVTLESGDSAPGRFVGIGVVSRGADSVTVFGGRIRGYRYGIRLEGGRGHRVSDMDLSGSRAQVLRSTPERYDESDWLDIFRPDTFETYGGGLYLKDTHGARVSGVTATGAQNGIGLFGSSEAWVADNDVSGNSGWGIHLWRSPRNVLVRNRAHHNVRCEGTTYRRGCDSAAILLREESDSNVIADNDLTWSGDGFFLSGQRPMVAPSIGNLVFRNDASHAWHNAFESTFSAWNTFIDNRADSSDYGFWLGYSRGNLVRGNTILGSRSGAIAIEHGGENEIAENTIIGGPLGLSLSAPHDGDEPSIAYRLDDNTFAAVNQAVVLSRTVRVRLRGNVFDGVGVGIVADSVAAEAEVTGNVFLSAREWLIDAVRLDAGDNFWGAQDLADAQRQVRGHVTLHPFHRAQEAGY